MASPSIQRQNTGASHSTEAGPSRHNDAPVISESLVGENDIDPVQYQMASATFMPPNYDQATRSNTSVASSPSVSEDDLPRYDSITQSSSANPAASTSSAPATAPGFLPTRHFQIDNKGHPLVALPLAPKPIPIPVYSVDEGGQVGPVKYTSMRDTVNKSSNCVLVRDDKTPVAVTTYRFGPSRAPRLRLINHSGQTVDSPSDVAALVKAEPEAGSETIEITSEYTSRSQNLRTPLGTFRWRYGTSAEKKEADSPSLLVLEKITTVQQPGGTGKKSGSGSSKAEERRRRVAQFVRNDASRSEGTSKRTAGGGGRLSVDTNEYADSKGEADEVEVLAIASCIVMMKKEVDRRRINQTVAIVATAGTL